MLLTAPELNHLRPITDAVEERILSSPLTKAFLPNGSKSNGFTRQPHWQVKFTNGTKIISRLPNKDGKGVKGQHVLKIELDEAQDYPLAGWIEIVECLNRGVPGAQWCCHGVPRGVRDRFWEITQSDEWTVHRPMAMNRPTWTQKERDEKTQTYGGSRQNNDYKRNIYGEHGDAMNPMFVLARFMACVDTTVGSEYNTDVYACNYINFEELQDRDPVMLLDIPGTHKAGWSKAKAGYSAYFGGMDVGATNHPSEILIFGQRAGVQGEQLDCLLRVHMQRIPMDDQKRIVLALFDHYGLKLRSFGIDRTGVGFPLWEGLAKAVGEDRLKGYNFSAKYPVALEDRPLKLGEELKDLVIERNVVEFSSDALREVVDSKSILLPDDRELLIEWQGQSYMIVKTDQNPYGRREYSQGKFHTLDAGRMMIAGARLSQLEDILNAGRNRDSVLDVFVGGL